MKIAFVNPPIAPYRKIMRNFDCATESKANYLYQPYDFLLMSARVPASSELQLIDAVAEKLDTASTLAALRQAKPDLVVLAMADTNWTQDLEFLRRIRAEIRPGRLLVCGDSFQEAVSFSEVEAHCDGVITDPLRVDLEGERFQKEFIPSDRNLKAPKSVSVGLPRHELFLNRHYRWPFAKNFRYTTIFTSWGCPYSCSYCIMSRFPNLWRPADEVLAEMAHVKKLGIREIYIGDRSFGLPRQNVIRILRGMIREKFGFRWSSYFHPNQYDPELLELMARSGCHTLIIGIESANAKTLEKYGRRVRSRFLEQLLMDARRLGIEICGDFIIGLPGDSAEDIRKTIELSRRLDIQYASFNIAAPLPGSSLRAQAIASGALRPDERHYDSLGRGKVLGNGDLDPDSIRAFRSLAVKRFYFRPRYLLRRLKAVRGWQHLVIQAQEAIRLVIQST